MRRLCYKCVTKTSLLSSPQARLLPSGTGASQLNGIKQLGILKMTISGLNPSNPAADRIPKVSSAIADLEEAEEHPRHHITEATQHGSLDDLLRAQDTARSQPAKRLPLQHPTLNPPHGDKGMTQFRTPHWSGAAADTPFAGQQPAVLCAISFKEANTAAATPCMSRGVSVPRLATRKAYSLSWLWPA